MADRFKIQTKLEKPIKRVYKKVPKNRPRCKLLVKN